MLNPRTPGVYVQELSLLPPSVAPVATAIPAFIGYTQKRGNGFPADTPKRITSLVDYEQIFGGPFDENYKVTIQDDPDDPVNNPPVIAAIKPGADPKTSPYLLYYAIQHYFANGGGPCYIVSVGLYDYDDPHILPDRFTDGVDALEQEDEPTLIVVPEAVELDTVDRTDLHNQMLGQCNKMQDRFALMDVLVDESRLSLDPLADANDFRNEVGTEYLKYGAAYYPSLKTTITKYFDDQTVNIVDSRASPKYDKEPLGTLLTGTGSDPAKASGKITITDFSAIAPDPASIEVAGTSGISFAVGGDNDATALNIKNAIDLSAAASKVDVSVSGAEVTITAKDAGEVGNTYTFAYADGGAILEPSGGTLEGGSEEGRAYATATITFTNGFKKALDKAITIASETPITLASAAIIKDTAADTATSLAGAITTASSLVSAAAEGNVVTLTALAEGEAGNGIKLVYSGSAGLRVSGAELEGGTEGGDQPDVALYQRILKELNAFKVDLYPSAAMAGIYAKVDRNRGVWKAPANVSMSMVQKTNVMVSADEQGSLNVDANTGKSVNVIRSFAGKGTLVWGARTLAGNDNEWRYVPVRRLFIFIEESIEKASEPFVFEPNDANTWVIMKGMIENFLTSLWRDGALAGAAPSDAFFVKVGLGETMTSLDILEGRLNIEVGIAAVRPAEFIILKFSHKLQES
ncbi:MAG: phage tail sheath C-terminal domain-containing protein [Cytophagales bacterium]|nr:phage tail sheath C-terminal domain-containing protein [Cytophagales bacterium]